MRFSSPQFSTQQYLAAAVFVLLTWWIDAVQCKPNYKQSSAPDTSLSSARSTSHLWEKQPAVSPWEPHRRPIPKSAREKLFDTRWDPQDLDNDQTVYDYHKLYFLNDSTALCNDGSPAGYYFRSSKHKHSKNWLIFLEGGWHCYDNETCRLRESSTYLLFSSYSWPNKRLFDGILSSNVKINPIYHNYHSVYIPYCSSDLWTGKLANKSGDFYFHGSRILQSVVDDIPWKRSAGVEKVIFAGSSAGGIGVLMNVDRLGRQLVRRTGHSVLISGIVDSAWFIHTPAYHRSDRDNTFECPAEEGIHKGMRFWKARIPKSCRQSQPRGEKWKCYLGPYMYEHLRTPVYIVQSLFDEAQMQMSKVQLLTGGTYEKWAYIQKLGKQVAQSLQKVDGVFAPSCIDHEILTKNNWVHKAIGNVGLVDALSAWDRQLVRQWRQKRMMTWSVPQPQSHFNVRGSYVPGNTHSDDSANLKFTRNSTLLFLSRLVSVLNQQSRSRRHSAPKPLPTPSPPALNNPRESVKHTRRRSAHFTSGRYFTLSHSGMESSALTMTRQPNSWYASLAFNSYGSYLNRLPPNLPSYTKNEGYTTYHVIDTCGLVSGNGDRGAYLCAADQDSQQHRRQLHQLTELDNLIPQCNPTCGFLSNPHRMKLVDVLALYEVNTDLLASILGLTTSELRSLDSEQQMRMLFCGNAKLRRRTRTRPTSHALY